MHSISSSFALLITVFAVANYSFMQAQAHADHDHDSDTDVHLYCATECTAENADNPCTDGKAQQASCSSTDFISMFDIFGYASQDALPNGFVGCKDATCDSVCAGIDVTAHMTIVTDATTGVKTFCFPERSSEMFVKEDLAEMSAISRGCSGAHEMNLMYMHGASHQDCVDSYSLAGVDFGKTDSASAKHLVSATLAIVASIAIASLLL